VKPFFIASGRGLSVPVYLRFEGRVKNLDLPKKDVEDLINVIWAARDTHNAVKRAQKAIEHRDKLARGEIPPTSESAGVVVNLGSGNSVEQLIDYDNIRFVKRLVGPFAEHIALFLIEYYGNNSGGGGAAAAAGGGADNVDAAANDADGGDAAAKRRAQGGAKGGGGRR
jgi:hypothetical protein